MTLSFNAPARRASYHIHYTWLAPRPPVVLKRSSARVPGLTYRQGLVFAVGQRFDSQFHDAIWRIEKLCRSLRQRESRRGNLRVRDGIH